MNLKRAQKGVGMMEVLVALLLLALGVLGFVGLQLRAVEATSEGFNRIQATNIARDLAEKIKINNSAAALAIYRTSLQNTTAVQNTSATLQTKCYSGFCTPAEKAQFDSYATYQVAQNAGMQVTMNDCPETANKRSCIYVSWGKTQPTNTTTTTDQTACTTSSSTTKSFSYVDDSKCVVLEAYTVQELS